MATKPAAVQSLMQPLIPKRYGCFNGMVFDVGLPRTGTSSVSSFGAKLGFISAHLMDVPFSEVQACSDGKGCGFYKSWFREHPPTVLLQNGFSGKKAQADLRQPIDLPGHIFEDLPTFGLACPLAKEFPTAKFVLTRRNFEAYYGSMRYALCAWGKGTCQAKLSTTGTASSPDLYLASKLFYGKAFIDFCSNSISHKKREKLCGPSNGRSDEVRSTWDEFGLSDSWRDVQERHDASIRQCIPSDRLLEIDMEDDDESKAQSLFEFLGCNGTVPQFPHKNTTPEKMKPATEDVAVSPVVLPNQHSYDFLKNSDTHSMAVALGKIVSAPDKTAADEDDDDGDGAHPLWDALGKGRGWSSILRGSLARPVKEP